MTDRYDWPFHNDADRIVHRWRRAVARGKPLRVLRWNRLDHLGLGYWLRHLRYEPWDFAYAAPRRLACRLLRRHNITCHGRPDCRRFGRRSIRVTLRAGEYVLSRADLAYMDTMARAVAPLLAPLHDRCCGCSGTVCCSCGEGPCSTS
ncbi:hypothetical protein [Streptomyces manipurensis]|uniref:hypothetical protein n=1 Tax=Streptomyces manipurensis TaxID=1077945 RepID=UPI003C6ED081